MMRSKLILLFSLMQKNGFPSFIAGKKEDGVMKNVLILMTK